MLSRWAYILIGNDNTGKTTLQKRVIYYLCEESVDTRLGRNKLFDIKNCYAPKALKTLFTINRSFQENKQEYRSVKNYFVKFFKEADVCVLSSHTSGTCIQDIEEMILQLKNRFYNVAGVFFSNATGTDSQKIALLNWTEIIYINNDILQGLDKIAAQLDHIARRFSELLIARASR